MKHFTGCLSQDLRRCLLSKQFVLSTIGVSLIHFLSAWWDIQASYSCVAYYYFVARVMGLENLFLVVAVIPVVIVPPSVSFCVFPKYNFIYKHK